ncbi:hypothetical protein [Amaricoccus sp.]|uniref:hypothetical protein n=1 Tax=Amaricoccus sp. TaxID=1872485 RepID=UPI001B727EEB|nr:hypothetical protein [Amaricoccus sp.]MBP7240685.1 hypothetical protein [Amaricoccus sp.]
MYAVIRNYPNMQKVEEAAKLAETGLGPILKKQPGFRDYYVVRFGEGGGSISVFDTEAHAKAAHERSLGWIKENLAGMTGGVAPMVIMGEVAVHITA